MSRLLCFIYLSAFLALTASACGLQITGPEPTATPPAPTQAPLPTEPPPTQPPPTQPPPTALPATPVAVPCVPSANPPPPVRPANFADYPAAILAYLNHGGDIATLESTLEDWGALPRIPGQVAPLDITGDGILDVALALLDPDAQTIAPPGDVLVFGCSDGRYILLFQEGYDPYGLYMWLLESGDLTGDGRGEVAYVLESCGAHTCFDRLEVRGWDGTGLVSLMADALEMPFPTYQVADGRIVAQSGSIGSVGAGPQRGYVEIWEWNGSVFTTTEQLWEPPTYRIHAALDGDQALRAGNHEAARGLYYQVILNDDLWEWGENGLYSEAEQRAQWAAFARWRLVLNSLMQEDTGNAEIEYHRLQADYPPDRPGSDFAAIAAAFWSEYGVSNDFDAGCLAAIAAVETNPDALDFLNSFGYANPWFEPEDLCPRE